MRKVLLMCTLILGSMALHAQYITDYETVKSESEAEIIYKGSCTFQDIAGVPAFNLTEQYEKYKAEEDKVAQLTESLNAYQLIIFLGTWCEDSHRLIPQLYRVLEDVGYPLEQLQIFALDREKKGRNEEEKTYAITNVPTIIVLKDGTEKGRITETVKRNIESDLVEIIKK